MKKYSITGLSLLAASAITAALAPSKEANNSVSINGHYTLSTAEPLGSQDFTCRRLTIEEIESEIIPNCSYTVTDNNFQGFNFSSTSRGGFTDSDTQTRGHETRSGTTDFVLDQLEP